ncbi:hypothetical protein LXL04_015670 [Taraxacum kok-saghyz]
MSCLIRVYPCLTRINTKHEFLNSCRHEYTRNTKLSNTNTENSCRVRVVLFVSCSKLPGLVQSQRYNVVVEGARNHLICAFKPFEFELDFVCKCGRDKTQGEIIAKIRNFRNQPSFFSPNFTFAILQPVSPKITGNDASPPPASIRSIVNRGRRVVVIMNLRAVRQSPRKNNTDIIQLHRLSPIQIDSSYVKDKQKKKKATSLFHYAVKTLNKEQKRAVRQMRLGLLLEMSTNGIPGQLSRIDFEQRAKESSQTNAQVIVGSAGKSADLPLGGPVFEPSGQRDAPGFNNP